MLVLRPSVTSLSKLTEQGQDSLFARRATAEALARDDNIETLGDAGSKGRVGELEAVSPQFLIRASAHKKLRWRELGQG